MTYKILIKGSTGAYQFAQMNVEETDEVQTIDGLTVQVGNGRYHLEDFASSDINEVKRKLISLLDDYRKEQLNIVADVTDNVTYVVDIEEVEPITPSI